MFNLQLTKKIKQHNHDQLPEHGIGSKYSAKYWQGFVRQAVAGGHLITDIEGYGGLKLGPLGQDVAKGNASFSIREMARTSPISAKSRQTSSTDHDLPEDLADLELSLAQAKSPRNPEAIMMKELTRQCAKHIKWTG